MEDNIRGKDREGERFIVLVLVFWNMSYHKKEKNEKKRIEEE